MAEARSLGGITAEEIQELSTEIVGPPTEAGATILTRFIRQLAKLVVLRFEKGESGDVAIFLQSSALSENLKQLKTEEFPLLANGNDAICGRVWLSTAALGSAYAVDLEDVECRNLGAMFQALRKAGLGKMPAFVVDFRGEQPAARVYGRGIDPDFVDDYMQVDLADEPIASVEMKATLDLFYSKSLRTPGLSTEGHAHRIWRKASHGWPENRPEERIHGRLMDVLRTRFTRHEVRAELFTGEGRVDIVVWTRSQDSVGRPVMRHDWALELKALTDRTSSGKPISSKVSQDKIAEGLVQVTAYRKQISALRAALCCYDMRKDDAGDEACFSCIAESASEQDVDLWRWYLYRSASRARRASD